MANLYHFFIVRQPGVTPETLEKVLNEATNWFRYHEACYIVETVKSTRYWEDKLKPNVVRRLFICKFDETHYYGRMEKDFWEWYQSKAKLAD